MNKKQLIIGVVVAIIVTASVFFLIRQNNQAEHVHLHAGFKVYVNGKLQNFSDVRYMSLVPCGDTDPAHEQLSKAHLHDNVGDVVHVHRKGALWKDLFQNMNYQISEIGQLEAYINGKKVENILEEEIAPYDSVIILVGDYDKNKNYQAEAVKKDKILQVEKKSELCGS